MQDLCDILTKDKDLPDFTRAGTSEILAWLKTLTPEQYAKVQAEFPPTGQWRPNVGAQFDAYHGPADILCTTDPFLLRPWLDPNHPLYPAKFGALVYYVRLSNGSLTECAGPESVMVGKKLLNPFSVTFIPLKPEEMTREAMYHIYAERAGKPHQPVQTSRQLEFAAV